ncbi:type II secretion system F family protein [Candidatus Parcubacteria bacterium]|nr:type II secretion system F family protein [Candidatus Parcubacteria bacterium]
MLFVYKALDQAGATKEGSIEAVNVDVAISALQKRGLIISTIKSPDDAKTLLTSDIGFLNRVSNKEIVILSRQIATLFEAQVSALRVFRLLAAENDSKVLRKTLNQVADDLQGGSSISGALSRHPKVFSSFYVNMVKSGEESGKLDEIFLFLADYMDRTYEVTSKARNALIYPSFVIVVFVAVMVLMLTVIIPKISLILKESTTEIPLYTKVVLGMSDFLVNYSLLFLVLIIIGVFLLWRYTRTERGKFALAEFKLEVPYVGSLYKKLYLSRISDNMHTMLQSGITMLRGLEVTAGVVGNEVYERILLKTVDAVKGGMPTSQALSEYKEIPGIMIQMIKVGEETGELGNILDTMAKFYRREVTNAVDTLVDLIEPVMIVVLGLGVAILLASVLIPIYNIASGI